MRQHSSVQGATIEDLELTISICSWNAVDDLRQCLKSLQEVSHEARFETIVVENNSMDGSGAMVAAEFPDVRLLQQHVNLGFTGGHNLATSLRNAPNQFYLNSDTIVHPGALRTMLDYLAKHPETGVIGPKLLNTDGTLQFSVRRFPNPIAALFRNTILGRIFPNNAATRQYLMKDFDHDSMTEADWVSGAAMLVSGRMLDTVGGFDPEFFMFCEDVDLCWRAWKNGFKVVYVPTALVTHHIGRSTDKAPNRMISRFHKSMYLFYKKHQISQAPRWARPGLLAFAATGLSLRAGAFIFKNLVDKLRRKVFS